MQARRTTIALLLVGCQADSAPVIDDTEEVFSPPEELADTGIPAEDDADGDVAGTGTGLREVIVTQWGSGEVCHGWWDTRWTPSSAACPDCEWVYNVRGYPWVDEDCAAADLPDNLRVGWVPDYDGDSVLLVHEGTDWIPTFQAEMSMNTLTYQGSWIDEYDEALTWYWYGQATLE